MCGIYGYIGKRDAVEVAIRGLKRLEYRGYDSAGLAGIRDGELISCKEMGKVARLEKEVNASGLKLDLSIAHTRWATHGKPSQINAHPHFNKDHAIAVVHNGIIENFEELKRMLINKGYEFVSQTDTEVITHLVDSFYEGDILKAVQQAVPMLHGSYALALIHKDYPDRIIAIAHESPLVIGVGNSEAFISSDSQAFGTQVKEVAYLSDGELAVVYIDKLEVYNANQEIIEKEKKEHLVTEEEVTKGGYEHFTLKEIHEQPQTVKNALLSRYVEDLGNAIFEELNFNVNELLSVKRILILACGTSWHAGYVAAYMLESMARLPVQVEISSEFRYKNPIVQDGTLVIAISQSGETADTLAAVRELKAKGARILGLCNAHGSTLVREADCTLLLKAGPEIGVCSTKAFTSQVVVLSLLTLLLARMRHMDKQHGLEFIQALKVLPVQVQKVLDQAEYIHGLAKQFAKYDNFFYLGRSYMYPTALEGALKLKEISYINANGYPAGEMKHGPIALINEECPTVALCANKGTYEKMLSNLMEVKARSGLVIAVAEEGDKKILDVADHIIWVPKTIDELAVIPTSVALQLFAYYIAYERGEDIDQPRNLAKSVTVE